MRDYRVPYPADRSIHFQWIALPELPSPPFIAGYRCRLVLTEPRKVSFAIGADERYELCINGETVGRGNDRGYPGMWFFETREIELPAGEHIFAIKVWTLGNKYKPQAQMSAGHGFALEFLNSELKSYSTGNPGWEAIAFQGLSCVWNDWRAIGYGEVYDMALFHWEPFATGAALPDITVPVSVESDRTMEPTALPEQISIPITEGSFRNALEWNELWHKNVPLTIAAHTTETVLLKLDDYYAGYVCLAVSGGRGAELAEEWAEALFSKPNDGHSPKIRNSDDDGYFFGFGNRYRLDGKMHELSSTWWNSGRYIQFTVITADEPLTIRSLRIMETRYPFEAECVLPERDTNWRRIMNMSLRTWQLCAHETYMDCPYYEQLMYLGDTRLQLLITYIASRDRRLAGQAIKLMAASQRADGLTQSRFPSDPPQYIPPFSLFFIGIIHDYAWWCDDGATVRELLPTVRRIIGHFRQRIHDGLIPISDEWNFCDWVKAPGWNYGTPPVGPDGLNAYLNMAFLMNWRLAAELEYHFGSRETAINWRREIRQLARAIEKTFLDPVSGLLADTTAKDSFSEHVQVLAVGAGLKTSWPDVPCAVHTTGFFDHYTFEALRLLGRGDLIRKRFKRWYDMLSYDICTTLEAPEPSRSDCHAWSAHPVFHAAATLAGIRPMTPGFKKIRIAPLWDGQFFQVRIPHPDGEIHCIRHGNDFEINLPENTSGILHFLGRDYSLNAGLNRIITYASVPHSIALTVKI